MSDIARMELERLTAKHDDALAAVSGLRALVGRIADAFQGADDDDEVFDPESDAIARFCGHEFGVSAEDSYPWNASALCLRAAADRLATKHGTANDRPRPVLVARQRTTRDKRVTLWLGQITVGQAFLSVHGDARWSWDLADEVEPPPVATLEEAVAALLGRARAEGFDIPVGVPDVR